MTDFDKEVGLEYYNGEYQVVSLSNGYVWLHTVDYAEAVAYLVQKAIEASAGIGGES